MYYNENDPKAAAWLRELIAAGELPDGVVDERSIEDVRSEDCGPTSHFFAGIGGWPYALKLAGWPEDEPVWTGICPCQFGSTAARGRNNAEDLWPDWFRVINWGRPKYVFGEQIQNKGWLSRVRLNFYQMGYQFKAAVLCASLVGLPPRRRLYFAAVANDAKQCNVTLNEEMACIPEAAGQPIRCFTMVSPSNGVSGRVALARGFGNAIVPQVAATFIQAVMECQ